MAMEMTLSKYQGAKGQRSPEVLVHVEVLPDPVFERDGQDVRVEVPISFAQAALGASVTVPTLTGHIKLKVCCVPPVCLLRTPRLLPLPLLLLSLATVPHDRVLPQLSWAQRYPLCMLYVSSVLCRCRRAHNQAMSALCGGRVSGQ